MHSGQLWYLNSVLTKKKILILIGSLTALVILNVAALGAFTRDDFWIYAFFNYGKGYFSLIEFLSLIILNGLPLYLIGFVMSEDNFNNTMLLVRFKSIHKNFNNMQKAYLIFFAFYILLYLAITVVIGLIFSTNEAGYSYMVDLISFVEGISGGSGFNIMEMNPIIILLGTAFLRVMELMVVQMIFVSLYTLIKNTIVAYLISMGLYLLLIFNVSSYFPIGISSVFRLLLLDENFIFAFLRAATVLVMTYLIGYFYILIHGYKKIFSKSR